MATKNAKAINASEAIPPLRWTSASHPISDIRDWATSNQLQLQPDYQRREVWSDAARMALMDTVVRNIPIPKVYLQSTIRDKKTFRSVVDGQQRISSILRYLEDDFALGVDCPGGFAKKKFSELSTTQQDLILGYKIDVNEIVNATDSQVRELYSRVNKYTKALSKQELRRADFPGDFLRTSEDLALADYFDWSNVFSAGDRRRMGDVEYISELLAAMISGPQNKKRSLDSYYELLATWKPKDRAATVDEFNNVLADLGAIFPKHSPIHDSRYSQKSDFYSLFLAIASERREGGTLESENLQSLRVDLFHVDEQIAPTSPVPLLAEYAVHCVSDANSESSRRWRTNLMRALVQGSYHRTPQHNELYELLNLLFEQMTSDYSGCCPDPTWECPLCGNEFTGFDHEHHRLMWTIDSKVFQIDNAVPAHRKCGHLARHPKFK